MSNLPVPGHGKFYDLDLPYDGRSMNKRLLMLVELGYEVVALNVFCESTAGATTKKQKKAAVPKPPEKLVLDDDTIASLKRNKRTLTQLSRITIALDDMGDVQKIRDVQAQGLFDLIAVVPGNDQLFLASCAELNIDIICLPGNGNFPYVPRHHLIKSAMKRGIYFEVSYSPMVRDTTVRRFIFANAHRINDITKGKNLILSSNAQSYLDLRGPYDVANLNALFGVHHNLFIHTVSDNCRAVVVHSFSRKTAKCALYLQKISQETKTPEEIQPCRDEQTEESDDLKDKQEILKIVTNNSGEDKKDTGTVKNIAKSSKKKRRSDLNDGFKVVPSKKKKKSGKKVLSINDLIS